MKANAITRIVIYFVLILVLLGILLSGLGVGVLRFDLGGLSGEYITGEGAVDASTIENIEIEWVSGDIDIHVATDGSDQIRFSESGNAGEDLRMVWERKGTTLIIKYSKPSIRIGFISTPDKDLDVIFPAGWYCDNLDLSTVSGSVNITLLSANEIELESVSASCKLDCTAKDVSLNTVSGKVEYHGEVETLECESVSADCSVILLDSVPERLTLNAVSGDLIVGMTETMGFSATLDSLSGNIYSDFNTTTQNGKKIYGDGSCQISADTVSGNINIKKYEIRLTDDTQA